MSRVIVDPSWPSALRRHRTAYGISLRQLAPLVLSSRGHLHDLETGRRQPTADLAARLDDALDAGGQLAALVKPAPIPPDAERVIYVAEQPRRLDAATLDAFTDLLASQRRLEDAIGAAAVIDLARSHLRLLTDLLRDARCAFRPRLMDLSGQWAQWVGWLHTADGNERAAARWLSQALEWATEAGNPVMIATILSFRGHLAEGQGRIGDMIGLSQAARRDHTVYPGLRAYCAGQEARGLAMADASARECFALLAELRDLAAEQETLPLAPSGYWYTPDFFLIQQGIVLRHLAEADRRYADTAVAALSAGIAQTAAEAQDADWHGRHLVQLGLAMSLAGDQVEAREAVERARVIAETARSSQLAAQVSAAVRTIAAR